jgi:hypothetical protein
MFNYLSLNKNKEVYEWHRKKCQRRKLKSERSGGRWPGNPDG